MSFSELLKQCRKQKGISQAELASKLGVTQQAVGKWESGKSSPDPATVARIAEILSTTADFLLGLYRPVSNVTTPEERFFGNYAESLIPVIGTVKAGYGALAFEEDYGQEYGAAGVEVDLVGPRRGFGGGLDFQVFADLHCGRVWNHRLYPPQDKKGLSALVAK